MKKAVQKLNRGLLGCYAAALALWLLCGGVTLLCDRMLPEVVLPLEGALTEQLEASAGGYASTGNDAKLIFEGIDISARRVELRGVFEGLPGEVDAYYARSAGDGFAAGRRAYGRAQDGGYIFVLPPGRVSSLRIDPGNQSGTQMWLEGLVLNPRQAWWKYFVPNLREGLALLVLPALAYCAIYTIIVMILDTKKRRRAGLDARREKTRREERKNDGK